MLRYALFGMAGIFLVSGCSATSSQETEGPLVVSPVVELSPSGLSALTRMSFPAETKSVGEAARFLLEPTGYRLLVQCFGCSADAVKIVSDPISPLAFVDEITSVKRALALVGGTDTKLVIDEENKLVSYDFKRGNEIWQGL
ncbi:hypothetical protein O4H49_20025 [Kiloniella laminariae]|uniref:Lipoprotein n=1 Tax=Kiloniella laminariae TaxID=454162 RepID=A0ABT4LPP4_9PROT|nr:hypothetical protein [Kiloniella laminariae]MCZ4283083.1 hypothetical protein [Kiloniella laminariae]